MDVWVNSASAAVQRTLEQVAVAAGHQLSAKAEAQCWIEDQQHPQKGATAHACITVQHGALGTVHALSVPAGLPQLLRALNAPRPAPALALANGWTLDAHERRATHADGQRLVLTEKECALLRMLQAATPQMIPREVLLTELWGVQPGVDTHTLETHIYRLRQKLSGKSPTLGDIQTENSAYRLVLDG